MIVFVVLILGVTQEEIDDTRLIPEKEMLEDMKYLADKGKDLEFYNREGTTPVSHLNIV